MKGRKKYFRVLVLSVQFLVTDFQIGSGQSLPDVRVTQLETQAERLDREQEDDSYELTMEAFHQHPVNMNHVVEEELIRMHLLETSQIENFISYRKLLGQLLSVHELQAIPGWDIETIRKLLPYIIVARDESIYSALRDRWRGGDAAFIFRTGRVLEKSAGYFVPVKPGASYYLGSPQRVYMRYSYNYRQLLEFGFSGEKDAGEPFFKNAQKAGFDFYSFHFYMKQVGIIKSLALGDFTVNLGQGLIQWQSVSFTKSSQATAVRRELPGIRAYHSAGEFNFHRGAAVSLQSGNWQGCLFFSSQKISTTLKADTTGGEDLFSSFQNGGYHRTASEIASRNNNRQVAWGGYIKYSGSMFSIGLNLVNFVFSRSFQKREEPYNLYSLKGKKLSDYSIDYSYTHGNLHLFGEFAIDGKQHFSMIQGALVSLGEKAELAFLFRNIAPAFQSLYGDAFTENTVPNNERGFYSGFAFRPVSGVQLDLYYDMYEFPWLKYKVDGPSRGNDWLLHIGYHPNRIFQLYSLYKYENKSGNEQPLLSGTNRLGASVKQRWQLGMNAVISRVFEVGSRVEYTRMNLSGFPPATGFLSHTGFSFNNPALPVNMAVVVFETAGYDERIYTYETGPPYSFSIPAYYGKGIHYYINLHRNFSRVRKIGISPFRISGWIRWSQTFYPGVHSIGSGLDEIQGNHRSEILFQLLIHWQ